MCWKFLGMIIRQGSALLKHCSLFLFNDLFLLHIIIFYYSLASSWCAPRFFAEKRRRRRRSLAKSTAISSRYFPCSFVQQLEPSDCLEWRYNREKRSLLLVSSIWSFLILIIILTSSSSSLRFNLNNNNNPLPVLIWRQRDRAKSW